MNQNEIERYTVGCQYCGNTLHDCGYVDNQETNPENYEVSNYDESGHYCGDCSKEKCQED